MTDTPKTITAEELEQSPHFKHAERAHKLYSSIINPLTVPIAHEHLADCIQEWKLAAHTIREHQAEIERIKQSLALAETTQISQQAGDYDIPEDIMMRNQQMAAELKVLREIATESLPYVEELMPDLAGHVCGHPDAACDGECQAAYQTQQLLNKYTRLAELQKGSDDEAES
jgi:hypothetical protein